MQAIRPRRAMNNGLPAGEPDAGKAMMNPTAIHVSGKAVATAASKRTIPSGP